MNQHDLTQQDWAYPSSEVIVDSSDQAILGKGAFGVVRKARWCGSNVAVKQLHGQDTLQDGEINVLKEEDMQDLVREMSICSRLRHPNLVLFLGVTYDPLSLQLQSIVTEILPFSMYDLLETKNIRFDSHEVSAMACDVANALAYLHERKPPVVHRDISARNVLVDHQGRAKLSDLGQAKVLSGVHSASLRTQNTTMPGCMSYSAPEVLTGRYSSPIDMFSFGVLITQLITGSFPRIDRREQQVAQAMSAVPKLGPLISRCLQLHPERRPTAAGALEELKSLQNLDSYIEGGTTAHIQRRQVHQYGPLAERWLRTELSEANRKLEMDLSTAEARLSSELGRWRVEADARDKAEAIIVSLTKEVGISKIAADDARSSAHRCREETESERIKRNKAEEENAKLQQEMDVMSAKLREQDICMKKEVDAATAAKTLCEYAEIAKKRAIESERQADKTCAEALTELEKVRKELVRTETEKTELNEWLEQSINRWEKEKSNWLRERTDLKNSIKSLRTSAQVERLRSAKQAEELGSVRGELESISQVALPQLLEARCLAAEESAKELENENVLLRDQVDVMKEALTNAEADLYNTQKVLDDAMDREQASSEETLKVKELVDKAKSEASAAVADAEIARAAGETMSRKLGEQSVRIAEMEKMQSEYEIQMTTLKQLIATRAETPTTTTRAEQLPRTEESRNFTSSSSLPLISPRSGGTLLSPAEKKSVVSKAFGSGGIGALVKLAKDHDKDVELLVRIVRMMRDKCSDEKTRQDASLCDAPRVLVLCMEANPSSAHLQQQCMRALGNVCFGHDMNRAAAGEAGAGAAVVRVLRGPALLDVELMGYGFTCVTNLAHHSPENRRRLSEVGVVRAVQAAMAKFALDAKLQQQGCWVMLTLAASDEIAQEILEQGGVSSVVAAMVNVSDDIPVQHFGCWALSNLAEGCLSCDPKCLPRFRAAGAVEVCKAAVKRFPNHGGVSQRGLLALKLLLSK